MSLGQVHLCLLIFISPTTANTGSNKTEEREQSTDRDNPVAPGIVLEEKAYHIIGFSLSALS